MSDKVFKDVTEIKKTENAQDIKLKPEMYRVAAEEYGLTLSEYLERMNPSKPSDKLTAFERQLERYGIRVNSDKKKGLYAGYMSQFFVTDSDARVLFPEFINSIARWEMLAAEDDPYDINLITGSNVQGLSTNVFKEMYVTDTEEDYQVSVVNELAGFPEFTIGWTDKAESMKKYGISIKWSYEFLRRARIDIISPLIQRFSEMQKRVIFREGLYFLVNGTGTDMTPAASSAQTSSYDTACSTAGEITYKSWLYWLNSRRPYRIDTVFCNMDVAYKLLTMTRASVDTLALRESLSPRIANNPNLVRGLRADPTIVIVDNDHISANTIIGIDSRYAARRWFEIGADITETEKVIKEQFNRMVLSHVSGFGKIFPKATHCLTLNT